MDSDREREILDAIDRKGVDLPCPRCGHDMFHLLAESRIRLRLVDGRSVRIPTAVVACQRCGAMNSHALGVLLDPAAGGRPAGPGTEDVGRSQTGDESDGWARMPAEPVGVGNG